MDNCTYNTIRILREISILSAFIERHAKKDAKALKHTDCAQLLEHLHNDLNAQHI